MRSVELLWAAAMMLLVGEALAPSSNTTAALPGSDAVPVAVPLPVRHTVSQPRILLHHSKASQA